MPLEFEACSTNVAGSVRTDVVTWPGLSTRSLDNVTSSAPSVFHLRTIGRLDGVGFGVAVNCKIRGGPDAGWGEHEDASVRATTKTPERIRNLNGV